MCGIIGEFSVSGSLIGEGEFRHLRDLGQNRGPDQSGYWSDGQTIRLGFNRLAILDLTEKGDQPISSPSGRYTLVFNGEIYNYKDLKIKYKITDGNLRSSSDSEVIVQLLDRITIDELVVQINGMFAMAVYDSVDKTITLMRDFAGIKPLFFSANNDFIFFASQFDQIFKHPKIRCDIDPSGLRDYIQLGYMHAPNTVFSDICQLSPGTMMVVSPAGIISEKKFDDVFKCNQSGMSETSANIHHRFNGIFGKVIERQLVSDVPVGAFLSGGIDSPLVCVHAKEAKKEISGFTVGLVDHSDDESIFAASIADAMDLRLETRFFSEKELLGSLDDHFSAFPEPFGDYSSLPTYFITKLASERCKVMLSGDGGDELFWGYPRFKNIIKHRCFFKIPFILRKYLLRILRRLGMELSYGPSCYRTIGDWQRGKHCHNSDHFVEQLLPDVDNTKSMLCEYAFSGTDGRGILRWLRKNEYYAHMQRVLIKVDRASMGNSLEVRVPFLDRDVISFSERIDPALGICHEEEKRILKFALASKVTPKLKNDRKLGFSVPIDVWLRGVLRPQVEDLLLNRPVFGEIHMNTPELKAFVLGYLDESHDNHWGIWILFALQKWADRYDLI